MSIIVGEEFEDFGNAPEVLIEANSVPAWEVLKCGMVRLFVCKEVHNKLILDHTDLITPDDMDAIGQRFIEIAAAVRNSEIPIVGDRRRAH